jgi:hypothetical protein
LDPEFFFETEIWVAPATFETAVNGAGMSVDVIRPPVNDMVFRLYGRPLHPELFDILAARTICREDYRLTVRVTRTGHVITWENKDVFLTEVTAAADQELPERRRLLHYRFRNEHNAQLACAHGVHYQVSFQVEVLPAEIFASVHGEILRDGGKRGLLHNFPSHSRIALAPLGFVTAEARPGCLFLSSFHTFPAECTVVKTQSLIERRS